MKPNNTLFVRNNIVYVYYGILLLILTSWSNTISSPPMIYRLAFLVFTIIPVFFRKELLPVVLTCFTSIAFYGYSYSYMPTMLYIYAGLVSVLTLFVRDRLHVKIPNVLFLLTIYVTIINFITGSGIQDVSYSFIIIILLFFSVSRKDDEFFERMSFAFAIVTFVLSLYFLTSRNEFVVQYATRADDLERFGWTDPNYYGTVLGMGTVFSVLQLFKNKGMPLILKVFYIAVIVVSLMTIALNASRGAVASVVGAIAFLMLFTKMKTIYKVLLLIVAAAFLVFLYNSGYMDLLVYRTMEDTASTAGGRTSIWLSKLHYWASGDIVSMIFGYGVVDGLNITGRIVGFHNDFLAALVDFGIIGFIIYLWAVIAPIVKVYKTKSPDRIVVYTLMVYLILTSFSLEPVTAGRLPYIMLLFTIYVLANLTTNVVNDTKI